MLTCQQVRAARAILRWRAADLAEKAGVNISTIQRTERTDGPVLMMPANARAVQRALEAGGVEFIDENGGGAGVRLRAGSLGQAHGTLQDGRG
jgi:transcriptional regulator with XRE-family HTH domain